MKIVTSGLLMMSGAYLALGLIHLHFWLAERARRDYLAFSIVCLSATVYALLELSLMNTVSPDEYNYVVRWLHIPGTVAIVAVAWFTHLHLNGRRWLFWTIFAVRSLALIINFSITPNINFRQITAIERVTIFGEQLSYPIGIPNPLMIVPQSTFLLLIIFCLDSSIRAWRQGIRRKAIVFGTSILLYTIFTSVLLIGVAWGLVAMPALATFTLVVLIAGMFYEVNYDMHRMAKLSGKLIEREAQLSETLQQLNLSAAAAKVGLWNKSIGSKIIWLSEMMRTLFGFSADNPVTFGEFLQKIHPGDRNRVETAIREAEFNGNRYHIEHRILLGDGQIRWVESRGKAEVLDGNTKLLRGASVDVTKRKNAEEAVHDLSRKLMNAQEKERARLARELHDDLSQSLALLSIRMGELRRQSGDSVFVINQIDHLAPEIERISADVHRISHELHPAKLKQLGLESTLRGLCRELQSAYPLELTFCAKNLPRTLPDDVSLCLYRITQESLQNVVKHSGAESARVTAEVENGEIILTVSDDGCGFDINAARTKESLGLISINERIRAINGTVEITSTAGAGTRIEARVPANREIV